MSKPKSKIMQKSLSQFFRQITNSKVTSESDTISLIEPEIVESDS